MYYLMLIVGMVATYYVTRHLLKERYFSSPEFLTRRDELYEAVEDHQQMVEYIDEILRDGTFSVVTRAAGSHAHLATTTRSGSDLPERGRHAPSDEANVHQCSLAVVRRTADEPISYLVKYFGFRADEETLQRVEQMGESIAQLEEAVANLNEREAALTAAMEPPRFIRTYYFDEFLHRLGASFSRIEVPYPRYAFEYVSPGGNSHERTDVTLDSPTIDALLTVMSERIRFRQSAAGQRALMTTKLRREIKERDDHTCRRCALSIRDEPHLLLEVDHIIPVSKGGASTKENLQTLCWKCNRSKSNKVDA